MKLQEEVYTSAAELLDRASGNLGIVARTRQFPVELEPELQSYRGYSILPQLREEAMDRHPPRFILGPCRSGKGAYSVTRVGFAGADHTGRTTPLAHHVIVTRKEMEALGIAPSSFAWALRDLFHCRWQQQPAWIEPPRSLEFSQATPADDLIIRCQVPQVSDEQLTKVLVAAAEALVQFPIRQQPVVICLPLACGYAALGLIVDVLQLVPKSIQHLVVAASHVIDVGDYVRDAWLMITYPDSPFCERCRERQDRLKPIVLDLSSPNDLGSLSIGPYGSALEAIWRQKNLSAVNSAVQAWDDVGIRPETAAVFRKVIDLKYRLPSSTAYKRLADLARQYAEVGGIVDHPHKLEDWAVLMVNNCLRLQPESDRWNALATIYLDDRWPVVVRGIALREIAKHPLKALPFVLELVPPNSPQEATLKADFPSKSGGVGETAIRSLPNAIRSGNARDLRLANFLLSVEHIGIERFVDAGCRLVAQNPEIADQLLAVLAATLETRHLSEEEMAALCRRCAECDSPSWRFWRVVVSPILQKKWESSVAKEAGGIAQLFFQTAVRTGTLIDDVNALLRQGKPKISNHTIDLWLSQTTDAKMRGELYGIFQSAGLIENTFEVQTADEWDDRPHTSRALAPITQNVGPIALPFNLSLIASALAVVELMIWHKELLPSEVVSWMRWLRLLPAAEVGKVESVTQGSASIWQSQHEPRITLAMLLATVALYVIGEFVVRRNADRTTRFTVVRIARRSWTVLLCCSIGYTLWPTIRSFVPE